MSGLAVSFVHKRIAAGIKGFVTTGSPLGAVAGFLTAGGGTKTAKPIALPRAQRAAGSGQGGRLISEGGRLVPISQASTGHLRNIARLDSSSATRAAASAEVSRRTGIATTLPFAPCQPGFVMQGGRCVRAGGFIPAGERFFGSDLPGGTTPVARFEVGNAVMGRYGAAYQPGSKIVDRAICLPGDVVANDGLCYPKRSISNKQRQWPVGRRPLLTGGEMRAISTAARAAKRLELAQKRLQKIGLMKKPSRRAPPRPKQLLITDHHHPDH